mgnify:FL=1|jgi:hypothetical protein
MHPIPCNCFLWFSIELNEILSFQINCYTIIPFILNCIQWDNFIPDQLLLQLMKCINCILFLHVIDTIVSFRHSQLNWMRKFHSRSIAPPIDEVHQLHPIHPCNWYHCFLSFPIEFIEIISFQFNCFSNWWGSTWIASYSSM